MYVIKTLTLKYSFIAIFSFLEGGYQIVSGICKEAIDIVWHDCHGNDK